MRLELGRSVELTEGAAQQLADVVIDSGSKRVTHLVVQPRDHGEEARLVPVGLAEEPGGGAELSLRCSAKDLERFDLVHRAGDVVLMGDPLKPLPLLVRLSRETVRVIRQNILIFAFGVNAVGIVATAWLWPLLAPTPEWYEFFAPASSPWKGEIELRRASSVYSSDGHHLGSLEGVVLGDNDRLTELFFQRGHLWWKREVAVPAESISKFESDMVKLSLKKDELGRFSGP